MSSLQRLTEKLNSVDSVMEPTILTTLKRYLLSGGKARDAIHLLSKNYRGWAQMVNLMGGWLKGLKANPEPFLIEVLNEEVHEHFDPQKADAVLADAKRAPEWFEGIINQPEWKPLVTSLLQRYPKCVTLQLMKEKIDPTPESEMKIEIFDEIFSEFSGIFENIAQHLDSKLNKEYGMAVGELKALACRSYTCYLVIQRCLTSVSKSNDSCAFLAQRLSQDITSHAKESMPKEGIPQIDALVTRRKAHPAVESALSMIERTGRLVPLSVNKLYGYYHSDQSEACYFLCDLKVLKMMVDNLISPNPTSSSHRDKLIFLLSKATTHTNTELAHTQEAIACIHSLSRNPEFATKLQDPTEEKNLLSNLDIPIAAQTFIRFCEMKLRDSKIMSTPASSCTFVLFRLLAYIIQKHPLLRSGVSSLLISLCGLKMERVASQRQTWFKQQVLSCMVAVVHTGHFRKILEYMSNGASSGVSLGSSLTRFFILKLLQSIQLPYSHEFVKSMVSLVCCRGCVVAFRGQKSKAMKAFVDHVIRNVDNNTTNQNQQNQSSKRARSGLYNVSVEKMKTLTECWQAKT